MFDILPQVQLWLEAGSDVSLVTVISVQGSAPRPTGTAMAVTPDLSIVGSVTGGCVESAVVEACVAQLEGDGEARTMSFGYSDAEAVEVGLTCGGAVEVFLQVLRASDDFEFNRSVLAAIPGQGVVATILSDFDNNIVAGTRFLIVDGQRVCESGSRGSSSHVGKAINLQLSSKQADSKLPIQPRQQTVEVEVPDDAVDGGPAAKVEVFLNFLTTPPRLIVFGSSEFAVALSRIAKLVHFRVTVCDPRELFLARSRFVSADDVVIAWPHKFLQSEGDKLNSSDAICILTHDPKFDLPAIASALKTDVGYVGVVGSRSTIQDRQRTLRDEGVVVDTEPRFHAPIGLDIGANSPEEVAVSILAEIIAARNGRLGGSLKKASGHIRGSV